MFGCGRAEIEGYLFLRDLYSEENGCFEMNLSFLRWEEAQIQMTWGKDVGGPRSLSHLISSQPHTNLILSI